MNKFYDPTEDWPSIKFLGADIFLPNQSGVYVVIGESHTAAEAEHYIYVGQAQDLKQRWKNGHQYALSCIREGAHTIRYYVTPKHKALEARLIAFLEPTINVVRSNEYRNKLFRFNPEEW